MPKFTDVFIKRPVFATTLSLIIFLVGLVALLHLQVRLFPKLDESVVTVSTVFIGEVGLGGELRKVNNINLRLKEVNRINFKHCIIPEVNLKEVDKRFGLEIRGFSYLKDAVKWSFK